MEEDDVSYEGSDSNYESGEIEKVTDDDDDDDDDDDFDENELQKVIPKVKKKVRINSISFYDSNCFVNFIINIISSFSFFNFRFLPRKMKKLKVTGAVQLHLTVTGKLHLKKITEAQKVNQSLA